MNKLSIIIPAYKEEETIYNTLKDLNKKGFGKSEIIVVDGSDDDLTKREVLKFKNIKYIKKHNSSRASSMNEGAKFSTGDLLIFLHADTFFPKNSYKTLKNLDLNEYNYGGFFKKFFPNDIFLIILSLFNNLNLLFFSNLLGDNIIFVSRETFKNIKGYRNIRLMEDVEISKKLKKNGKIKIIKEPVFTSSRKFNRNGTLKTILFMQYMRLLHFLKVRPSILEKKYKNF